MNTLNIWESICKFLDVVTIWRCRLLSKKHAILSYRIVKERVFELNPSTIPQMIDWVYNNVTVANMESRVSYVSTHDEDYDELVFKPNKLIGSVPEKEYEYDRLIEIYCLDDFINLPSGYNYEYEVATEDEIRCLEDDETGQMVRLIPKGMDLDTILYLKYPLIVENNIGINSDTRGTRYPKIEFGDFYENWTLNNGFFTLRDLAEACFRVKSHKFDNWYEMIQGLAGPVEIVKVCPRWTLSKFDPMCYYGAKVSANHGS